MPSRREWPARAVAGLAAASTAAVVAPGALAHDARDDLGALGDLRARDGGPAPEQEVTGLSHAPGRERTGS